MTAPYRWIRPEAMPAVHAKFTPEETLMLHALVAVRRMMTRASRHDGRANPEFEFPYDRASEHLRDALASLGVDVREALKRTNRQAEWFIMNRRKK